MQHSSLDAFLKPDAAALRPGPVAMIFVEDFVEVDTTIRHHLFAGFKTVVVFADPALSLPGTLAEKVHRIDYAVHPKGAVETAVNALAEAAPGTWFFYCYNAEYLFFPFSESRNITELLAFHAEERRNAMLTYVVDLYAADLDTAPNGVSLEAAHLDQAGYYALERSDLPGDAPRERQLDFYGGLRWRFEEFIPQASRRIDRISLFRAKPGVTLVGDHLFSDPEYNTYACPWHNNLTAAICSFRTAKALKTNAGSMFDIDSFMWHNSTAFDWQARQLMDLGLMEPGQWF